MHCLVFDDRFCTSKKGGIGGGGRISAWGAEHMAVALAGCRMALVGTDWTISLLAGTNGHRKHSSPLVGHHFWYCRQFSVGRSVSWLKSPDHWMLTNEWVWSRSQTFKECFQETLAQFSSASSKRKWKYRTRKVSVASKNLLVNSLWLLKG